eukprot:TRINITY_DN539_c0_g1_i5.p2 TRINITY_DN539_c0_g1~~TRINITY_DN539_c0_g1_i5.p2  ORF type:complete len:157 (+),score=40.83 TRINITY_DN539_c0_g1_i5:123-593(+)
MACPQFPYQIAIIILSICLIFCSSLFWWYFAESIDPCCNIAGIILFIGSGVMLVLLGLFGIFVGCRKGTRFLFLNAFLMAFFFLWQMIQLLIATIAYANCDRESPLKSVMCDGDINQYLYYAHVFITLIVCMLSCVFSMLLRRIIRASLEDEDNYY